MVEEKGITFAIQKWDGGFIEDKKLLILLLGYEGLVALVTTEESLIGFQTEEIFDIMNKRKVQFRVYYCM